MATTDSRPVPIKNTAYRVIFPILDADGDLVTGATGLDSEVSKDCGTFADCTNEATEIATSSGMYYLDLTSTEMNADSVAVIVKTSSSGAKTTPIVLYPQESGDIKVDVQSYGGTAGTFSGGRPEVNTTHAAGTAWGSGAITAASIAADAITAAKIATGAIDADAIADNAIDAGAIASGAITSAKFAAGAIDAAAIADNAIDLATFATDAKALFGVVTFGTMQAGSTGTTAVLASATSFADDIIQFCIVYIRAGTGAGQVRGMTDWVSATDTATVDPPWTTTPDNTSDYIVFVCPPGSTTNPLAVNLVQVGGSTTNVAALATNVDAILTDTAVIGSTGQGLTSLATQASVNTIDDFLDTEIAAIKAKTDNLPAAPAATGDAMTLTSAYDFAKGTAAMTESYATDGAAMTPAQALHQIWALLAEKNIASTTLTAKKLDGSTTAMTFTLDDATNPTSITRAT